MAQLVDDNALHPLIDHVDSEDEGMSEILTPEGKQQVPIINESVLYSLILSSKIPKARQFKRWV